MSATSIFLIDDHKLFIDGISTILNQKPEIEVIGHAFSAKEYLKMAPSIQPDVILMDINMPGMTGIELTRIIKENNPDARILALTMFEDPIYIQKMAESGANGYILKSAGIHELLEAIKLVAAGKTYLAADIQDIVMKKIGTSEYMDELHRASINTNQLSKRELEVLSLLAKEYSNQEIAEKLYISERTVETHRKNIFAKTKAKSLVGLVKYALREGLVY